MRYVVFQPTFTGTAYDLQIEKGRIAALLAERPGWTVTIASAAAHQLPHPLQSVAIGKGRLSTLRCIWRLAPDTDVLQLLNFHWRALIRAALYRLRNPRGVCYLRISGTTAASLERDERRLRHPLYRWLLRWGFRSIDLVSAESTGLLARFDRFLSLGGVRRLPTRLIVSSCGFDAEAVEDRMARVGAPEDGILYVGRIGVPVKATDVLLAAFRRLREELAVDASLTLVGPVQDGFMESFRRWRDKARAATSSAVSFVGPIWDRGELIERYLRAKVFVICSRSESGPNAFVEAASCGCLLVGTKVGEVADVIAAVGGGWEVEIEDVGGLAQALADAVRAPDGEQARRGRIAAFRRQYSWSGMIDRLAGELEALSRARGGRPA